MFAYDAHYVGIGDGRHFHVINRSSLRLVSLVRELLLGGYSDIDNLLLEIRYSDNPDGNAYSPPEDFYMCVHHIRPFEDNGYHSSHLDIYVSNMLKAADPFPILGGLAHELAHERTGIFVDPEKDNRKTARKKERKVDEEAARRGYGPQLLAMKRVMQQINPRYDFLGYSPGEFERLL